MTSLRLLAVQAAGLALANAHAKIHEQGGNNLGDAIEAWQAQAGANPGDPWCEAFGFSMYNKSWCQSRGLLTGATDAANRAILLAHAIPFANDTGILRTASCKESFEAAQRLGRTRPKEFQALPGDQVYYDMPVKGKRRGYAHHTGIVIACLPDGTIKVVEGNTSSGVAGSQGDGDGVFVRVRGREFVYGFAHLA